MRRALAWVVVAALSAAAPGARAQSATDAVEGPAGDLYIRRRPTPPDSPRVHADLRPLLAEKEKLRDGKRKQAIGLLEQFLATEPTGDGRAEALFKLAELLWEDTRRQYVFDMSAYERKVEACRTRTAVCARPPTQPQLDFSRSEKLYRAIVTDHPAYKDIDLVLYLVGFAAREAGRSDEANQFFTRVIQEYPESPLYTDSWMMIAEHHFAQFHWDDARKAYARVLEREGSKVYDLALFKSAWCEWKLGDPGKAAGLFKKVLDRAETAQQSADSRVRRQGAQLREEALNYLVVVFTEDESLKAKDVYDFLASIGGEQYSRDILIRLAGAFYDEASYERSIEAYRFLIGLAPGHLDAAVYQRRVVEAHLGRLAYDEALAELQRLADDFGPDSAWAKANQDRPQKLARSYAATEELLRGIGKTFHGEAQRDEQSRKRADLKLYERAAATYQSYLSRFASDRHALEVRFLRAEILFFKLGQHEGAGDEYLAVGKTAPVGTYHKDALLKAMAAYEKARPPGLDRRGAGKRELLPVDRKFAEATDLYATLFPKDKEIIGVIFRNGQLFYDYGDYDEAVKRFGLIVTQFPDDPNAGAAGDRILEALAKGEDYENVETWARRLKQAKAFSPAAEQARLDQLIVESIGKSGEKYGAGGHYAKAAGFYLRVPKEFPRHPNAAQALFNAGVMLEKAKQPEDAAGAYLLVVERYPKSPLAARSAFTAGQVYEAMAYFDKAAAAYEVVADKFGAGEHGADALYNAGVLRQALGEPKRAIAHYERFARQFRDRKDAAKDADDIAFRVGVVYEEAGDDGRADRAFRDYASRYRSGGRVIEAHTRSGRTSLRLGQTRRAAAQFATALKEYKGLKPAARKAAVAWAAEARYHEGELIYRAYARIDLDVNPRKLRATLDRKTKLLDQAQNVYLDVVEYNDPQWATAALYRIGRVYEEFADSLRQAPVPPGLDDAEKQAYRDELDNYVIDIEEKAIELYGVGYRKALELKVYNKFTRLLREALGRLAASRFPPERESRERQRVGDRPPTPEPIQEVLRDE